MTAPPTQPYPATLEIDYQEANRDRVTTFFRMVVAIPIGIIYYLLTTASNTIVFPTLLMILFRQKYPRWWFDFNLELARFATRVFAYMGLLVDEYPSTDEAQRSTCGSSTRMSSRT